MTFVIFVNKRNKTQGSNARVIDVLNTPIGLRHSLSHKKRITFKISKLIQLPVRSKVYMYDLNSYG